MWQRAEGMGHGMPDARYTMNDTRLKTFRRLGVNFLFLEPQLLIFACKLIGIVEKLKMVDWENERTHVQH